MTLPAFICIGAQKAGTTWLNQMLRQNESIWTGPFKEIHYFNSVHIPGHRQWAVPHVRTAIRRVLWRHFQNRSPQSIDLSFLGRILRVQDIDWIFTEEWYRYIFSLPEGKGKIIGDITLEYSTVPIEGIFHMKNLLPDARIIYVLREPYARMLSQLRMMVSRRCLDVSKFGREEWLKLAEEPNLVQRGDYPRYVPLWQKNYGDALLVLPYGEIAKNPGKFMRDIEKHVGAPSANYKNLEKKVHKTKPIEIPDFVKKRIEERAEPARDFVRAHLGEAFARAM